VRKERKIHVREKFLREGVISDGNLSVQIFLSRQKFGNRRVEAFFNMLSALWQ